MIKLLKFLKGPAIICAILAPLMMFLEVSMDLMQPTLMANIIDIGVKNRNTTYVISIGFKMLLAAFIGVIGGTGCTLFATIAAMRMGKNLRQGIFDKIQTLSFLEIDKLKTASLITRLTNDVTQVQNMMLMALRVMVRAPLMCVGGIVMATLLIPQLSLIFLVVIPIIVLCIIIIVKKSFPIFLSVQEKIDRINVVLRESILGVQVVKAFTIEEKQGERFEKANYDLMNKSIKAQNINLLLWPIVTLIMNLSVISVLWIGGNMTNSGTLQVGKIMAFINYLIQIMNSLIMAVNVIINFSRAKASADRINEVLGTISSIQDSEDSVDITNFDIEFKNVYFKYNEHSDYVLKDISFVAKHGEKIGIIGATGSGKSSFVSLIPRLYDATAGEILIGNVDVKNIKLKELRDNIGVVMQDSILFSGTIEDNLKFGNTNADMELIESSVRSAQAYEFISSKENTYKSIVEQRGKNLSGGQKQRLSIARTLMKKPEILILDDSASALDM
jgi:ATP-binding cassette subfamily B multidrug efflux pump